MSRTLSDLFDRRYAKAILLMLDMAGEQGLTTAELAKDLGSTWDRTQRRMMQLQEKGKIKQGSREGSWIPA